MKVKEDYFIYSMEGQNRMRPRACDDCVEIVAMKMEIKKYHK